MDASQPTPPQELPPDVRSISEALLLRLSQWMSYDLAVNSTELLLRYQNGRLQWIAPQPRIGAVAFPLERAPDDPGTEPPKEKGLWQRLTG